MDKKIGYILFDGIDKFVITYGKKYRQGNKKLLDLLYLDSVTVDGLLKVLSQVNANNTVYWYSNAVEGSLMAKWLKDYGVARYVPDTSPEFNHQNLIAGVGSQQLGLTIAHKKIITDKLKLSSREQNIQYPPEILAVSILVTLSLHSNSFFG